jgi:hypothetical protein
LTWKVGAVKNIPYRTNKKIGTGNFLFPDPFPMGLLDPEQDIGKIDFTLILIPKRLRCFCTCPRRRICMDNSLTSK